MVKQDSFIAPDYGGGVDYTSGPENLSPTQLALGENWRFTNKGGFSTRLGTEQIGDLSTSAAVDNMFTHEPYNVMFAKSDVKIKQSVDGITWYDTGLTRTATEVEAMLSVDKDVHVSNQVDSYTRIAVSTLAADVAIGAGSFVLRTGDGVKFTSGTAYIDGEALTVASGPPGSDTCTLTGTAAAAHLTGAIVTQTTAPSGAPKASCLGLLEGSTLAGGVLATPSVLYYSAHATPTNPEYAYDYVANGAGFKSMPSDIKAIGSVNGAQIIVLKKGVHAATTFDVTTEALLTNEVHANFGGVNNRCIVQGQRSTYLLDGANKRIVPLVNDINGIRVIDDPMEQENNLDYPVQGFMKYIDQDQSGSFNFFDAARAEVKFCVLKNGIRYDVLFQESIGRWVIDIGANFKSRTNFKGDVVSGSDTDGTVYVENSGYTDNGVPIFHRMRSPTYNADDKRITLEFLKYICGGILSSLGEFRLKMYANDALLYDQTITADSLVAKGLMVRANGQQIGSGAIGQAAIGSGGEAPTGYRFTCPVGILFSGESFYFEIEIFDEGTQAEFRDSRVDYETDGELIATSF